VFDSRPDLSEAKNSRFPLLLQHFVGWTIETDVDVFDAGAATFMDFSVPQNGNTRFMYVLPESPRKALVEYTLFSEKLLEEPEYENAIDAYLKKAGIVHYTIPEKEKGAIPMTVFPFWKGNSKNVAHIGSAGGWTKASTGFTFRNTVKLSAKLSRFLKTETDLRKFHRPNRFRFYDRLLLDVLHRHNEKGAVIFASMFKNSDPKLVLKFLDEETTVAEDLRIIWSCPKGLFIAACFRWIFGAA
jgi:lycopene beta-cyclase